MLRRGEVFFAATNELNDANECRPNYILRGSEDLWRRLAHHVLEEVCLQDRYFNKTTLEQIRQVLELSQAVGTLLKKYAANRDIGVKQFRENFTSALKIVLLEKSPELRPQLLVPLADSFIKNDLWSLMEEGKYIASFSLDAINPTMWGHYAGAEKGFVVVYGTEDSKSSCQIAATYLARRQASWAMPRSHEIGIYQEDQLELHAVKYSLRPPKVNAFHRLIPQVQLY